MTLPEHIAPMKATTGPLPPDDGWAFEVKWDGYRTIAFCEDGQVRLQSANLLDVTRRWPSLGQLGAVLTRPTILDGEVVAFDEAGRPSFHQLQQGQGPIAYVVFDLLHFDGRDLTGLAYTERRALLESLLEPGPVWTVPAYQVGGGQELFEAVASAGLEGVVAKRLDSRYEPGRRTPNWRKVKHRRQQEVVVGGWLAGEGSRANAFGALLVGVHDGPGGPLRYAGRVGSGFSNAELDEVMRLLAARATDQCPFDPPPPRTVARVAHWVEPDLVAEVAFAEWTGDGILRQPSFLGWRDDKDPTHVVQE